MKRKICSITIILVIIITGLFKIGIALFEYKGKMEGEFSAIIYNIGKETRYMKVYTVKIGKQYFLLYTKKSNLNIEIGDTITFYGDFSNADVQRNYKGFDYKLYLKTKKISGIFKTQEIKKIGKCNNLLFMWKKLIYNVKSEIITVLENNLKKENSALLSGILIGEDSKISTEDIESFKRVSLTHMLAISGENFMYVVLLFNEVNKKIKIKRVGCYATIFGILFFMELTGNSASVVRAGVMCILYILAKLFHRKYDVWTSLAISALIQIVYNPYSIFEVGLLLSYGGVIGIVGLCKRINKIIKSNVLCGILSANIIILPISIYNFNELSIIFIISNFFASFFIEIATVLGFISIFIRFKVIYFLLDFVLTVFYSGVKLLSSIPFSSVKICTPSVFSIIMYYSLILVLLNKKKIKKYYNKIISITGILLIVFNLNYQIIIASINQRLLINFIDVGQGDCTLIRYKSKSILIDGGGNQDGEYDIGKNVLIPYLLNRRIKKIDYIIISHFDTDHVGGLVSVLEELKVHNIVIAKQGEESENYNKVKALSNKKKIPIIIVDANHNDNKNARQTLKINEKLFIDVLWPQSSNFINKKILNNNSIVCKLRYNTFSLLFTGDIEEIAEKQIIKDSSANALKSTVLKVGHHGSNTSSSQEFINKVKPKIALIGVGKNNKFGHPNDEVIKRLKGLNCKIYRTDLMGEISMEVDSKGSISIKNKINI